MPTIEQRVEAGARTDPDYAGLTFTDDQVKAKAHRSYVGRYWEAIGRAQLDFLVSQGLKPEHKFLDVGVEASGPDAN